MIWFLRILSVVFLAVMTWSVVQSSLEESLLKIPAVVTSDPWFITTIFDVYIGLLLFYVWICLREKSLAAKLIWLPLLIGLGNIATSLYAVLVVWQLPTDANIGRVLLGDKFSTMRRNA